MADTQLLKIAVSRSDTLPSLPENPSDSSSHPFIYGFEPAPHIRKLIVVHPAGYKAFQLLLPVLVTRYISSSGKLLDLCF